MFKQALSLLAMTGISGVLFAGQPTQVKLETSYGDITVELDSAKAPKTVANFLGYVNDKFYDGTIFHRVIKGFMVQGGGMTPDMKEKATKPSIQNEADNGLKNLRGTLAMARTPDPNSASSQFFINTVDNDFLNFSSKTEQGWGYCVFGKVLKGMNVVDSIANTPKGMGDVPNEPILIKKAYVVVGKPVVKAKGASAAPKKDTLNT
jgi:cyclophilin family peptidyl-prolyl cis-trans isomerase